MDPVAANRPFPVSAAIVPGQHLLVLYNSLSAGAKVEAIGCPVQPKLLTSGWQKVGGAVLFASLIMLAASGVWAMLWCIPVSSVVAKLVRTPCSVPL